METVNWVAVLEAILVVILAAAAGFLWQRSKLLKKQLANEQERRHVYQTAVYKMLANEELYQRMRNEPTLAWNTFMYAIMGKVPK